MVAVTNGPVIRHRNIISVAPEGGGWVWQLWKACNVVAVVPLSPNESRERGRPGVTVPIKRAGITVRRCGWEASAVARTGGWGITRGVVGDHSPRQNQQWWGCRIHRNMQTVWLRMQAEERRWQWKGGISIPPEQRVFQAARVPTWRGTGKKWEIVNCS